MQKVSNELTWHEGKETPSMPSGSFLILTTLGDIAEAEYHDYGGSKYFHNYSGPYWLQYRWSSPIHPNNVVAWCRLRDIKLPEGE